MFTNFLDSFTRRVKQLLLAVPVRWKIVGIGLLPVVILGFSLNYWITTGLSDWLSYILTDVRVEAAMAAGSRSVMFVTVIAAFLSIILLWFLVYILTSPLEELKETAEKVADGQYGARAEVWGNDEIGALAQSVNQMIDNLLATQEDLARSNRQLSATNQIALAAEQANEIHDVLFIMLENVLDLMGLETGWVYLYDPELRKHHLASWKGVPEGLEAPLLSQESDDLCACQQDLQAGELGSQVDVRACRRLETGGCTGAAGRHITIPIAARNIQFGVVNLHNPSAEPLDEEHQELLSSFGIQISEIVANAWLQIKLREKEAARQMLLASLVNAQEDERRRLARELHDQAGQTLTNLLIRLKTIENKSTEPEIKEKLHAAQEIVSQTIDQVRDLSYSLRPPALEEFGIGAAVGALAEEVTRQTRIKVKCNCRLTEKVSPEVEMILYRIVQEGLTNVVRHAGATEVRIDLERQPQALILRIEDNGRGFDPGQVTAREGKRHLGLISMSERAELIGGKLDVYSAPGEGTSIQVFVPVSHIRDMEAHAENPSIAR